MQILWDFLKDLSYTTCKSCCLESASQHATQFEASLMSVAHLLTSLTLSVSHSNSNASLHYYQASLWDEALQTLFSLNILSQSKRRMLHLLGSLIGRRVKVQRVDEKDRNPITPGVTQFHWNGIDHNQHDSWWSLAPTAAKKPWLFSMIFHNLLHTYCQSGI